MYSYDARMDGVMLGELNGASAYRYAGGGSAISPPPRVRMLFPETWLWNKNRSSALENDFWRNDHS
uniref:Uncharacterized protein n=1 Tax=Magallana gigas TaxID=29159 RepID=K1R3E1_MAGGI